MEGWLTPTEKLLEQQYVGPPTPLLSGWQQLIVLWAAESLLPNLGAWPKLSNFLIYNAEYYLPSDKNMNVKEATRQKECKNRGWAGFADFN